MYIKRKEGLPYSYLYEIYMIAAACTFGWLEKVFIGLKITLRSGVDRSDGTRLIGTQSANHICIATP